MTQPNPFTTVTDQDGEDRDFIPIKRCKGKLLIVRPLEYQREGYVTVHKPDGTDAVFCDFALLDPIHEARDLDDKLYPGYAPGHQFRNQVVLQGYLKGTFKRYIGGTLIGTIYEGVATKGNPPLMWQDLSTDVNCVNRGQRFMAAHPEFLVPQKATITTVTPEPAGPPAYTPPSSPVSPAAGSGYQGYQQPDPWAQRPAEPVSPAPAGRMQTTLDQLRSMGQMNHQNQVQSSDPPF